MSKRHLVDASAPVGHFLDVLAQAGSAGQTNRTSRRNDPNERVRRAAREEGFAQGRAEGYAAGFAEGVAEGRASFEADVAGQIEAMAKTLDRLSREVEDAVARWCQEAETRLGPLAASIAARIVAIEVARDPELSLRVARDALREVMHGVSVRLRVNPFDAPLMCERQAEILAATAGIAGLEIVADASIEAGCRVESDGGVIDARVEAMLARAVTSVRLAPQNPTLADLTASDPGKPDAEDGEAGEVAA